MKPFEFWLKKWSLTIDGKPIITKTSQLLPVQHQEEPCILKIALIEEEQRGGQLMTFWNGNGAAKVFLHDQKAILMERAKGLHSLTTMAKNNQDDEASTIICEVIAKLHNIHSTSISEKMITLPDWFKSLEAIAQEGLLKKAWCIAEALLKNPREMVILHGDIHHQNILDFGDRGWLAIDPKGLYGEHYFDYANIFCNPEFTTAIKPGRLEKQAKHIASLAGLEYSRLLQWIFAYAGLSAAWHLEEGSNPDLALAVAEISADLLSV